MRTQRQTTVFQSSVSAACAAVNRAASPVLIFSTPPKLDAVVGTVFSLTPPSSMGGPWTETVLHAFTGSFAGGSDGSYPLGGLTVGKNGILYGTTAQAENVGPPAKG